jgi:hypothetical protein
MPLHRGCYTAAIFIDVSKAFDCVDHSIFLTNFFRCEVRENGFKIIQDYVFVRTQVISSSRGESSSKFMTSGKLPLCFTFSYIYQRNFWAPFEGTSSLRRRRAILIYSESNYDELQRHMREDLLKSKTKYVIFNPKNKNIPQPNRLLGRGAEIEREPCVNDIRNTLDSWLMRKWTEANMFHTLRRKSGRF